jgi:cold shock CspA family protein
MGRTKRHFEDRRHDRRQDHHEHHEHHEQVVAAPVATAPPEPIAAPFLRGTIVGWVVGRNFAFVSPHGQPGRQYHVLFTARQLQGAEWEDLFHGQDVEYLLDTPSAKGPRARVVRPVTQSP